MMNMKKRGNKGDWLEWRDLAGEEGDSLDPDFLKGWFSKNVIRIEQKTTAQKLLDDPGSGFVMKCEGCGATCNENSKAKKCPGCSGLLVRYHVTASCDNDPRHDVKPGDKTCRSCGGKVRVIEERA